MNPRAIAAQDALISSVGRRFDRGDAIIGGLIEALGGNPVSVSRGNAGIPTTGSGVIPGGRPFIGGDLRWGGPAANYAVSVVGDRAAIALTPCVGSPELLPLVTVFQTPAFVTALPAAPGLSADAGGVLTGGPGSSVVWGSLAALAFALWALPQILEQQKRRR